MVGGCSEGRCETGVKRKEPPTDREREREREKDRKGRKEVCVKEA